MWISNLPPREGLINCIYVFRQEKRTGWATTSLPTSISKERNARTSLLKSRFIRKYFKYYAIIFFSFKIIKIYFPRWHDGYGEILSCGKSAGVSIKISFSPMNKTDIFQNAPVSQFKCRNLYLKLIVKYIL